MDLYLLAGIFCYYVINYPGDNTKMKKLYIILYVMVLIVLVSFVSAERPGSKDYDDYSLLYFGNGTACNDVGGGKSNGSSCSDITFGTSGSASSYLGINSAPRQIYLTTDEHTTGSVTFEVDIQTNTGNSWGLGFSNVVTAGSNLYSCGFTILNEGFIEEGWSGDPVCQIVNLKDNFFTFVTVYNLTSDLCYLRIYNNTDLGTPVCSADDYARWTNQNNVLSFNMWEAGTGFTLFLDNLSMYEGDGIKDGKPQTTPTTETATPTIIPQSPLDNSNNNTNVTLNVSHSTLANDVRYYLYFGLDNPPKGAYLFNVTRTGAEYKEFTTNITDEVYYWSWQVQNITNGVFSANTTVRTLTIDTVNPTIARLPNNNWKIDNSTIISSLLYNLTINISFFDSNLVGGQTLINITNSTNDSVYENLTTSILGTTNNISEIIDIGILAIGNYTIILSATDSHTANSINNYDVKAGINYFRYTTEEGNVIKIKSNNINLFTKSTTKLTDRYNFEFNYLFQQDTHTFTIESYNKIIYLEDSIYNAHFIVMGNNGRGNWIDFNAEGLNKKDYKVTKIDDYTYEVEITANGLKSFTFNSLGGLNTVEEHYKFKIGAVLDISVGDEETRDPINATATIGSQFAHTISNSTLARLVNITKETTIVTLNSTGYGIEEHILSLTRNYHNLSLNMSPVLATRISFYDENSEELIEDETFSVFLETPGFSNTFTGITDNPHTITSLGEGIYTLKASSDNYQEREYQDLNVSNTTTTLINIYLINNTLGQQVTFTVQGSGGNRLDNADVDFFRVINGTNIIIAQENTDFAGQVKLYLDPNYEYDINLVREGYISRNITLEPSDTEYTIILLSGEAPYESSYEGVRFRFYHNGVMSISPPDILNLTNTTQNITFEVEGTNIDEIGINFTHHNYACIPASCSVTLGGQGQVKLGILLNETGTFNTGYYFQKTDKKKIYVNDGLIKVIPFIFASLDSLPEWVTEMKGELSPNLRTLLVAMLNVIAVGIGSSLGIAGTALVIPVLAVTIIASLPEIGLIHPFIGMIIAIFGVGMYVYSQTR